MNSGQQPVDEGGTTFDGSRREQLRRAQRMTVRQRLEALDELTELSERMKVMPRQTVKSGVTGLDKESTPCLVLEREVRNGE